MQSSYPSHPELLEELTRDFVASGFDQQHMIRVIMNSRTYQTSSLPNESNTSDTINYSHTQVRRIEAEEMLDTLSQVTGSPLTFNGYPEGMRALHEEAGLVVETCVLESLERRHANDHRLGVAEQSQSLWKRVSFSILRRIGLPFDAQYDTITVAGKPFDAAT